MRLLRAFLPTSLRPSSSPRSAPLTLRAKDGRLLARRQDDRTQILRHGVQLGFALLNIWIGVEFYRWVRFYETAGAAARVDRPAGVEGWLPIAALMNLKYWVLTWEVPEIHAAGMFLLVAFLAMSWLARKAFCSWLCPIGTLSEVLWEGGRAMFGGNIALPRWLDLPLRSLKYILFGLFAYVVVSMSVGDLRAFLVSPYGLIADVKMLDFFRHMGRASAITIGVLLLLSLLVKNAWCRYLCPYGAMLGLVALVSPVRIRRTAPACTDCGKCAQACPSLLPVDRLASVRSAECTNCLLCITACPSSDALACSAGRRVTVPSWAVAAAVVVIFAVTVAAARATGHWDTLLPDDVLFHLIPRAATLAHP
jgi:polyferredoxin